jgi:ubiquitin-conjugating enzyme E2 S
MSSGAYGSYSRSNSSGLSENLPPKTLARVAREIRDLHKCPPEGVRLVVDSDTGVPSTLGEVLVSCLRP